MIDPYVYQFTSNLNEKQKSVFIDAVEKITGNGWWWRQAPIGQQFQVWDGDVLLGEGVTLDRALESAEGAK